MALHLYDKSLFFMWGYLEYQFKKKWSFCWMLQLSANLILVSLAKEAKVDSVTITTHWPQVSERKKNLWEAAWNWSTRKNSEKTGVIKTGIYFILKFQSHKYQDEFLLLFKPLGPYVSECRPVYCLCNPWSDNN